MKQVELELIAERAYADCCVSATESVSPILLARHLLGAGKRHVVFERDDLDARSITERRGRGHVILLQSGMTEIAQSWFVALEIARHLLPNDAAEAERLAACLRAPRPAVRAIVGTGTNFFALASRCEISESSAVLRLGEATSRPAALVIGDVVRFRGERQRRRIRWTRIRLSDAANRVALLACA